MRWFGWVLVAAGCSGGGSKDTVGTDAVTDATTPLGDDDDTTGVDVIECVDAFEACGGDPTGMWNVTDLCTVPIPDIGCAELTYEIDADRSSGTVDLQAGGAYSRTTHVDADLTLHVPMECIAPLGCAGLVLASGGLVDDCVENGTVCDCTGTVVDDETVTGTWTLDGPTIVADGERTDFCIHGNQAVTVDESDTRLHWARAR